MIKRDALVDVLNAFLEVDKFRDDTYNGLQVEGKENITKIGFSVDSSLEVYERAIELKCDMLIVHHALIWGGIKRITGINRKRIKTLLENDLNLYVCHLPLDKHKEVGNNANLIKILGGEIDRDALEAGYVMKTENRSVKSIIDIIKEKINKRTRTYLFGDDKITELAVISGGMSVSTYEKLISEGIKNIFTGELFGDSMFYHQMKEDKVNMILAGHYETEIICIRMLMEWINNKFTKQTETILIDIPNI